MIRAARVFFFNPNIFLAFPFDDCQYSQMVQMEAINKPQLLQGMLETFNTGNKIE